MPESRIELPVVGMTCANCAATVERTLNKKVPGVKSATVNFGTESAHVDFDPEAVDLQAIDDVVAMESADITLVSGEPMGVARSIHLSKATMRTIKQDLFRAFFYNVALVPVAAGALFWATWLPRFISQLHPAMAAGAMAFSSVTVVLNSLPLARRKI